MGTVLHPKRAHCLGNDWIICCLVCDPNHLPFQFGTLRLWLLMVLLSCGVSEINSKPDSMVMVIVLMSTCKFPCADLINH